VQCQLELLMDGSVSPVDRYAALNQAEKERNGKQMTDPY
jgi:hypothetical protein